MYSLVLAPGTVGVVPCPFCNQRDPLLWNSGQEELTFQFESKSALMSRDCDKCAKRYYWTPVSVSVISEA